MEDKAINTRYPLDIHEKMTRLAERHHRSFNAEVMTALEEYIDRQGTGDYELTSYIAGYTQVTNLPIIHWQIIEVLERDNEGKPLKWRRNEDTPYYYDVKELAEQDLHFYNHRQQG